MIDLTKLDMSQETTSENSGVMFFFIVLLVAGGFFLYKTFVKEPDENNTDYLEVEQDKDL